MSATWDFPVSHWYWPENCIRFNLRTSADISAGNLMWNFPQWLCKIAWNQQQKLPHWYWPENCIRFNLRTSADISAGNLMWNFPQWLCKNASNKQQKLQVSRRHFFIGKTGKFTFKGPVILLVIHGHYHQLIIYGQHYLENHSYTPVSLI